MATNPMQRKSRISFLLGMLVMLVIAALVIAFLYMQIQNKDKELAQYKQTARTVYVLNQDVTSGQVLTPSLFMAKSIVSSAVPADAVTDLMDLENAKIMDTNGNSINAPSAGKNYYYYRFAGQDKDFIIYKGDNEQVTSLSAGDRVYYYEGENNTGKKEVEIAQVDAVVAKIGLKANSIMTKAMLVPSEEITTRDLRKTEYNVLALPVDLAPQEYIDVRLVLPNGQNYIVVSKKQVSIPMVNGIYLPDTIQMNLTEEEILIMSCAIVESYQIQGAKLEAVRYVEAGLQEAATMTYYPTNEVQREIQNNPNVTLKAIQGIIKNREAIRNDINSAVNSYKSDDPSEDIKKGVEEGITSTQESRQKYLQGLTATTTN